MSLIALNRLKEGAVLSADVRDIDGRLILPKGQRIEADHIVLFKTWGIPEVHIKGTAEGIAAESSRPDSPQRFEAEQTVERIFQNIGTKHPALDIIAQIAIEHRYRNDLIVASGERKPLSEYFKLDLSNGLKTQIYFSEVQLPETPEIISDFNRVAEDPLSSVNDIADVVSRSPSLAALLLKIANSAFYGLTSKVDTISRAVVLLGTREVGALAMGIGIMRFFRDIPENLISMSSFLRHSLACGILSRILGAQLHLRQTERLFVSGLLHDIGRLIWYRYFPNQAQLVLQMAKSTGLAVYDIERECLGISHEQIAAHLFNKWQIPDSLANSVIFHHRPSRCQAHTDAAIVHMADIIVNALGLGHSGEHIIPRFEATTWDVLKIPAATLVTAIQQTIQQLDIMETHFKEL